MPPWSTRVASGDGCAADRCDADTMKPRCENACGKLPIIRFVLGSYSSENMPTSFCRLAQPLEQRARLVLASDEREVVDQPERRQQERPLAGRETVDPSSSEVG